MKVDITRTVIAVLLGALIGWGYYAMTGDASSQKPLGFIMGIEAALACFALFGISYEDMQRSGVMIRTASGVGLALMLLMNGIYAWTGVNTSFYVLNGILALIVLLAVNGAYRARQ